MARNAFENLLNVSLSWSWGLGWPEGSTCTYVNWSRVHGCHWGAVRMEMQRLRRAPTVASGGFLGTRNCLVPLASVFTLTQLHGGFPAVEVCELASLWEKLNHRWFWSLQKRRPALLRRGHVAQCVYFKLQTSQPACEVSILSIWGKAGAGLQRLHERTQAAPPGVCRCRARWLRGFALDHCVGVMRPRRLAREWQREAEGRFLI